MIRAWSTPVHLAEAHDPDIVLDVFEEMAASGADELSSLDAVLTTRGSSLAEAFQGFSLWNVATGSRAGDQGYRDAASYPEVPLAELSTDLEAGVEGITSGLSANYYFVPAETDSLLEVHAESERTAAVFVPFDGESADLSNAAPLPTRVTGPGAIVVSGITTDKRDARYWIGVDSAGTAEDSPGDPGDSDPSTTDAGLSTSTREDAPRSIAPESGCSLSASGAAPTHAPTAWLPFMLAGWALLRRRPRRGALLASLVASGCGAAPSEGQLGQSQQAIVDGQRDADHPGVFRLLSRKDGVSGLCTGVLITPNLVLTARHCVAETPDGFVECGKHPFGDELDAEEMLVANDVEPNLDSRWYPVADVRVMRDNADLCGQDVALLRLGEPIPRDAAVPHAPYLDQAVPRSTPYTALGYGLTSDAPEASFGERRARTGLQVACGTGTCVGPVTDTEFIGEEGICNGDSGGPALSADGRVLGVASRGGEDCSEPVYAAVEPFKEWIVWEAERAARNADFERPDWLGPEPEDDEPALKPESCGVTGTADRPALAWVWGALAWALAARRFETHSRRRRRT